MCSNYVIDSILLNTYVCDHCFAESRTINFDEVNFERPNKKQSQDSGNNDAIENDVCTSFSNVGKKGKTPGILSWYTSKCDNVFRERDLTELRLISLEPPSL